jgi:hypothetical protein
VANTYVTFTTASFSNPITEYVIPFPFLQKSDVVVNHLTLTGTSVVWTQLSEEAFNAGYVLNPETNVLETTFIFGTYCVVFENGQNKIKFRVATAPAITYNVTLYRRTFISKNLQFTNGSPIQATDLNTLLLRTSYSAEEAIEAVESIQALSINSLLFNKYDKVGGQITGNITATGNISSAGTISATGSLQGSNLLLQGGTIQNVPTPAYNTDAVNKAYVDALTIAGSPLSIVDNSVTSENLRKVAGEEAVTTSAIRDGAVTPAKIGVNNVVTANIANLAVTNAKIGTSAISANKMAPSSVLEAALASNAVTNTKIADNSISTAKLQSSCITNDKIASGTITTDKLVGGTIDGGLISSNTISSAKLQNSPISWFSSQGQLTIQNGVELLNGAFNAPNTLITSDRSKELETVSDFKASQIKTDGTFIYKENTLAPVTANALLNQDLTQYENQPVTFTSNIAGEPPRKAGGVNYNLVVRANTLGYVGATTIIRLLRDRSHQNTAEGFGNSGEGFSDPKSILDFQTLSDIKFNSIHPSNDNPGISLDITTGLISFGSTTVGCKYLLTLKGTALVSTQNAVLTLYPPSDGVQTAYGLLPYSMQSVEFSTVQKHYFTCSSILTISSIMTTSAKYYLSIPTGTSTPSTKTFAPLGSIYSSNLLGTTMYNILARSSSDPRVELVIQRIK